MEILDDQVHWFTYWDLLTRQCVASNFSVFSNFRLRSLPFSSPHQSSLVSQPLWSRKVFCHTFFWLSLPYQGCVKSSLNYSQFYSVGWKFGSVAFIDNLSWPKPPLPRISTTSKFSIPFSDFRRLFGFSIWKKSLFETSKTRNWRFCLTPGDRLRGHFRDPFERP